MKNHFSMPLNERMLMTGTMNGNSTNFTLNEKIKVR